MRSFDEIPLTTMTLVMNLDGVVFLNPAFNLLPITRVHIPSQKKKGKRFKLNYYNIPGAILSMRCGGCVRGIMRSDSPKYFKNSITIDMDSGIKNVSMKLSPTSIHMCGARSEENGLAGAELLLEKLKQIQIMLDMIQSDPEHARTCIEIAAESVKGEAVYRDEKEDYKLLPAMEKDDFLVNCFLRYAKDFAFYSDYLTKLEWILTVKQVVDKPIKVLNVYKAMVNYNYSLFGEDRDLGFRPKRNGQEVRINRRKVAEIFNKTEGFYARYDNAIDYNVTIEIPYTPEQNKFFIRKTKKTPKHTFLIYCSGLVTQSGPGGKAMKDVYEKFWQIVEENWDEIKIK